VLREPDEDYFWKIIRYPVKFDHAILGLLEMGDYVFVDASPSGALATYLGDILPPGSGSIAVRIMNPFGLEPDYLESLRAPSPRKIIPEWSR
jgi:acyl transferase domain-containing protein